MADLRDDYVRNLAYLARISLSDEEVTSLKPQLNAILSYVEQLDDTDTSGLTPTSQVTGLSGVSRADDDVTDTAPQTELLNQTPAQQAGQIKVPKVLP